MLELVGMGSYTVAKLITAKCFHDKVYHKSLESIQRWL